MGRLLCAAGVLIACMLAGTTPAGAAIDFAPCAKSNDFACGHLKVPLDPTGAYPGTVTLAIRRHRAAVGEARSAIVALAGGPGQAAMPFAEQFAELLGPIAATRDLIVFDQRGIGLSGPLSCHAFERIGATGNVPAHAIAECGAQLGPARGFYTSADTVADIEAIRRAGGYEKLVLYGTSYGTKVAEEYAQRHPEHVEALVLDSVVPPGGPEPLERPTFAAIPRVLAQVCAHGACRGATRNPLADLRRLLARMRHRPLRTRALRPDGGRRTVTIGRQQLLGLLLLGDFSGSLRAAFVSSVASAARGDLAPLARLLSGVPGGESEEDFDVPLYFATTCEEQAFPWNRGAAPARRLAQAIAAARALPASAFAPFSPADALALSDIPACAWWPSAGPPAPPAEGALPSVPTLVLSGADDLRTPTSGASEVAAEIPGSHLLVVPYVGHSVLGSDPTTCATDGLQALFVSGRVRPCPRRPEPLQLRPEARAPLRLAALAPAHGYSGVPGRTVSAVEETIADLGRELALTIEAGGGEEALLALPELQVGGLRAGWARLGSGGIEFHDYSYVPGVTLSGSLRAETARLQVGGGAAARGTLHLGARRMLVGTLDGRSVQLPASPEPATAIVGSHASTSSSVAGDPAAAARTGRLARALRRVLGA